MRATTASAFSSVRGAVVDMVCMKAALVAVLSLVGTAMSQYQSFYAGGGWSYPGPLPQFAANAEEGLDNRVGQVNTTTTTTQSPDQLMNSHVGAWPEDRQPFWFVNRDQIQEHLGRPQPEGSPQGQGTQVQPQNLPGSQTEGAATQGPLQNQPQPQDLPNTRSQAPATGSGPQTQPQAQDDQSQVQSQLDADRQYQLWLRNLFYSPRLQQWWAQNQPDTQTPDAEQPQRWRGSPAAKTIPRRQ